jgi:hypothetical protein
MNQDQIIDDLNAAARRFVAMVYGDYPSLVAKYPAIAQMQAALMRIQNEVAIDGDYFLYGEIVEMLHNLLEDTAEPVLRWAPSSRQKDA